MRRLIVFTVAVLAAGTLAPTVAGLPDQAAQQGQDHTRSHGPDGLDLDPPNREPGALYDADTHAVWLAGAYDGLSLTTDAADLTDLPTLHAVYVYPAKTSSRFGTYAAMFQADARQASSRLATWYGRSLRWDERLDIDGRTLLDITVFQSKYNARQLAGGKQFSLVANELRDSGKFSDPNKKYVAWLDAGSRYCGQGTLYQDRQREPDNASDVNRTTGIVYRPYRTNQIDENGQPTGGFCRGRTLLHEIGHNLGALQNAAPNAFDGAHCDDDDNDIMCYTSAATTNSGGTAKFDWGNDDYWDAGADMDAATAGTLPWWAVNLSRFVCPPSVTAPATADCTAANNPVY